MKFRLLFGAIFLLLLRIDGFGQNLKGGFDPIEYLELMKISARTTADSSYYNKLPTPERYTQLYQSPEMGLKNLWDLWINSENNTAVISIRGTTPDPVSWMGNFYAGMVSATGSLYISNDFQFDYQLAENPRAAVHVGWLVGTAFLSRDILPKIDSLYQNGIKEFLIIGHSQGGGIAYLLTSHLHYLQKQNKLPADISWKTYCSAAPKPGNLYFAYEYEIMTQGGMAYNIVNSADWVPQVPFSIQTIDDFNEVNPFKDADKVIKNQKFPERLVMKKVFNQLDKPTRKAQKSFEKYLGEKATKLIQKNLPEFQKPEFVSSNNYVRTGNSIILQPDDIYKKEYPNDNPKTVFIHHVHKPYMDLLKRQFNLNELEKIPSNTINSFKFSGNEPFWGLEINDKILKFQSMVEGFEMFNSPWIAPTSSGYGNSITFLTQTESGTMRIEILKDSCTDSMSGIIKPLTCTVSIKRGVDTDFTIFEGCGDYLTN